MDKEKFIETVTQAAPAVESAVVGVILYGMMEGLTKLYKKMTDITAYTPSERTPHQALVRAYTNLYKKCYPDSSNRDVTPVYWVLNKEHRPEFDHDFIGQAVATFGSSLC